MSVSPKLEVVDGINTINLDIDVLKEEEGLIYQASVFRHNVDHYEHFYKTDLENDCNHGLILNLYNPNNLFNYLSIYDINRSDKRPCSQLHLQRN